MSKQSGRQQVPSESNRLKVLRGDTEYSDEGQMFGYGIVERDEEGTDAQDCDIHFWPLDADHFLDLECECRPKIEMQWAAGMRLIIHRKTN